MVAVVFRKHGAWKELRKILSPPRMTKVLRENVQKATGQNALYVQGEIQKNIAAGVSPANAALTMHIKGAKSTRSLVDTSALFNAITFRLIKDGAFVGVLRTNENYNVADIVHEGRVLSVTAPMRALFRWLFWASIGKVEPGDLTGRAAELWQRAPGGWRPIRKDEIRIPSRPFIQEIFERASTAIFVERTWRAAVAAALR